MKPTANDLPPDFVNALKVAGLNDFFSGCTNAHQREYLKWIGGAKRPETRQTRIAKSVLMISAKRAGEEGRRKK